MKNILAFAGSNSSTSINHQLLEYVKSQLDNEDTHVDLIRLTDFDIPMYGIDIENNTGIPDGVKALDAKIQAADALVISVAEHNGNVTAFFKSISDWLSRNNRHYLEGKKILLLSTSPGKGGAGSALELTNKTLPFFKGEIVAKMSVPSFNQVLQAGELVDDEIKVKLATAMNAI